MIDGYHPSPWSECLAILRAHAPAAVAVVILFVAEAVVLTIGVVSVSGALFIAGFWLAVAGPMVMTMLLPPRWLMVWAAVLMIGFDLIIRRLDGDLGPGGLLIVGALSLVVFGNKVCFGARLVMIVAGRLSPNRKTRGKENKGRIG